MKKTQRVMDETAAILFLRERLGKEGQIVLPQVRNGAGYERRVRTADALIVETWPSRGQSFTGVEYKRTIADWRAELRNPEKADEIGKYCKYWIVLAPHGLIPLGEVPEAWGLWEIRGRQLLRTKPPPATEYTEPTMSFVCSILRSNRAYCPSRAMLNDANREAEEVVRSRYEKRLSEALEDLRDLKNKVYKFGKLSGISLEWATEKRMMSFGKSMQDHMRNPDLLHDKLNKTRAELQRAVCNIDKILSEAKEEDGA